MALEVVRFKCPKCGKRLSVTQSDAVKVASVLCVACSTVSWLTPEGEHGKPQDGPKPKKQDT